MLTQKHDTLLIRSSEDIVRARQAARTWAVEQGFSLVSQTKLVTAVSEIARNMVVFGGGGTMRMEVLDAGAREGLRLTFEDKGPGIPDIELAMKDGYTTGNGLGLGLGGTKRLVNEFDIVSRVGEGTRVTITMWQ
ncbi:anti-sigma regulatory factor [Candidatus Poribacteria bacterium]|nr:anti-sigma regulatory factor [Candidatus Poribacteria bacterium]